MKPQPLLLLRLVLLLAPIPLLTPIAPIPLQASGLKEPGLVLYGKVTQLSGAPAQVLHTGTVLWTIIPPTGRGAPFSIPVHLEPLDGGNYSYRLDIPVEKLPSGASLSTGTIEASASTASYRLTAKLGSQDAHMVRPDSTPHSGTTTYSETSRGKFERIDLYLAANEADADGDGIPDWWEALYPMVMDPAKGNDAYADPDGDGVPNYAEYLDGTDPSCFEWAKWLDRHQLTDPAMMAPDADPDKDGIANLMEYAIGSDPRTPDAHLAAERVTTSVDTYDGERYLVMTVDRPGTRHCNVDYVAETSGNLGDWSALPGISLLTLRDDRLQLKFRDVRHPGQPGTDRRFIRVRFVYKP